MQNTNLIIKNILSVIKNKRKELKLTQEKVANKLSLAKESYRDIESGKNSIKLKTFLDICIVLNLDPKEILNPSKIKPITLTLNEIETIKNIINKFK